MKFIKTWTKSLKWDSSTGEAYCQLIRKAYENRFKLVKWMTRFTKLR